MSSMYKKVRVQELKRFSYLLKKKIATAKKVKNINVENLDHYDYLVESYETCLKEVWNLCDEFERKKLCLFNEEYRRFI